MSDRRHKTRGVVATATAVVTLGIAAPLAAADPAPRFIPQTQQAPQNSLRQNAPRLGEGLTGADRSWLTPSPGERHIGVPSGSFNWADAGIGAGAAAIVLVVVA